MKLLLATAMIAAALAAAPAHARKDCEELKTEIASRIDAKGVKSYTLEIVAADAQTAAKVVGSCNGGTQRIVYQRSAVPSAAMVASEAK